VFDNDPLSNLRPALDPVIVEFKLQYPVRCLADFSRGIPLGFNDIRLSLLDKVAGFDDSIRELDGPLPNPSVIDRLWARIFRDGACPAFGCSKRQKGFHFRILVETAAAEQVAAWL
jgi:hypothetical protein